MPLARGSPGLERTGALLARDWFLCEVCGSPSVSLPARLDADSPVCCSGCGQRLGSWADYRRAVSSLIIEHARDCRRRVVTADPLAR